MNEPYSPTAPRPPSGPRTSPGTMKMLMCFLAAFVVAQTIGTALFCLYLHMKTDKMEETMSLNEDYVFLRKVQKCQTAEGHKSTLLDCDKILSSFQDLQCKDGEGSKQQPKFEMQKGHEHSHSKGKNETTAAAERRQPIAAHLAGDMNSRKVSVLQWRKTGYAPMSSLISYHEGKLKVERAGLYYIYSQVSFCTKATTSAPFTLYIYLYLPNEADRLLLKGLDTHSTSQAYCDLQSIREGGVFELREGDMVFVNVTDSTQVNYNHGSTYFGMFKL
ncbi:PREDICTED: LOW QUALITY PROTEIN: CD40 ligand [Tinamus guttatus]|uniref:LOW QUALITY PROTEIN: CD40 ligand n=1 Tax=Tinamus guttatus TaxID=94827 RepID=UPI00052F0D49|nr:PREDICTED: LOW QUALITY PROTEIN: CD40 ligand [Tinamus guttatus]